MKLIKRILFFLLLGSITAIACKAQKTPSYFLHTVERGQSLYSISNMYSVTEADVVRLNPGSETRIYAGQALKIPQRASEQPRTVFHTIQPGETLYKLSRMYGVSVEHICEGNPGLSAETFRAGEVVRIPVVASGQPAVAEDPARVRAEVKPRCKDMHRVERKETIFSVCREYGLTEQELIEANPELKEGMKKGQWLCIPYLKADPMELPARKVDSVPPPPMDMFRENELPTRPMQTIKAALILPFLAEVHKTDAVRMVEYYEGFLMAVDSLKRKGVSIDLCVYDSGDEDASIDPVLAKEELQGMDIIFGPLYKQHIRPLADFADRHGVRLVIPVMKDDEVFRNGCIYQVNAPPSYLYSEVYERFASRFPNGNVIVLDTEEKDKAEFIDGLKAELGKKEIPMQVVTGASLSQPVLKGALRGDRDNVFIPTSGNVLALNKIMPQLKILVRENTAASISLFGYPEWQTYAGDYLDSFFELNTYFYSSFYTHNLSPATKAFNQAFRRWYSKEMLASYPKYGLLGFDTALFFLSGLEEYGMGLEHNLSSHDFTPVQTGFKFERVNNWGGFINRNVFFIQFTKDFELVRIDFE
ncbi:MAG: LysM peptidoglycan-binding domain-containing protein [Mediterranea sp.]|jgi:LysM repeat protein/ABC-type branched-subunit amino acid transport system substrate-binding protein|nr:LysM peptidoglycan-binding domain-containing protein [Mediterranea sp.]